MIRKPIERFSVIGPVRSNTARCALMICLACWLGCGGDDEPGTTGPGDVTEPQAETATPDTSEVTSAPVSLVPDELGSTRNVHRLGDAWLCGQPSEEDLQLAKERGIGVVLTLRAEDEVPWDEQAEAEKLGLEFHRIDFTAPETLTDEVFDETREVLRRADAEGTPVMLHCGSANRVGAVWMAYRVLDQGVDVETAEAEAVEVGLRTEGYKTRALEYINSESGN